MKYFLDFEFLEGAVPSQILGFNIPKWLVKPNNTIQQISVGIVAEDGREYYAISKEFNLKEAWNRHQVVKKKRFQTDYSEYEEKEYWLRDNVLKPIYDEFFDKYCFDTNSMTGDEFVYFNYANMKLLLARYGKTNKQIADEILRFTHGVYGVDSNGHSTGLVRDHNPQFYAYYADYDWVAFCWLFGNMIDLPKEFPMYCIDLKQRLDDVQFECSKNIQFWGTDIKKHPAYPKQTDEHNALADARWNKQLHDFLKKIK